MSKKGSRGRANVSYVKPSEPSFIKRMKEQVGFMEGPNVDTKREQLPIDDEQDDEVIQNDKDDEKPQVVVLGPGDLSQEEVDNFHGDQINNEDDDLKSSSMSVGASDGKIAFRKPTKRQSLDNDDDDKEQQQGLDVSSNTKRRRKNSRSSKGVSDMQRINNKSLLSFNDDEHDDGH